MKRIKLVLLCLLAGVGLQAQGDLMSSLRSRPYPQWFSDAKLGIFVHYGLYSVPSYSGKEQYAEWFYKGLISGTASVSIFKKKCLAKTSATKTISIFSRQNCSMQTLGQSFSNARVQNMLSSLQSITTAIVCMTAVMQRVGLLQRQLLKGTFAKSLPMR